MVACGEEEVPSCQQAMEHYYGAGCSYYDIDSGDPISAATMVSTCRDALRAADTEAPSCADDVDDWIICLADVPSPATINADCDCSVEQEALLTCE